MIAVIDYGVGNLRSVEKALQATGYPASLSNDPGFIREAERIVLPGVGAFGECISRLRSSGMDKLVYEAVENKKPILGLCVGLQMMFEEGFEFGRHEGLGLMRGRVIRFPEDGPHVPQIGWNQINIQIQHPLLEGIEEGSYFYFVHSYYVEADDHSDVLAATEYGINYASICGRGNLFGVQFHPEKSQITGLMLLKNFASL